MTSKTPCNEILTGECISLMADLPAGCADMIFADPPYNLQLENELLRPNMSRVDGVEESWDRFGAGDPADSFAAYDAFTKAWLNAARHALSDKGTLWVIGSYHNIYRVGAILLDLGFWLLNDIIWVKANPMPNFRGVRFTNAHETLLWAKKSRRQSRYTFNHHTMKKYNAGKQLRSDWLLPLCTGSERLSEGDGKAHPTQKPEALLERVIVSSTRLDDLILDPFFGTGTTGAVAKRLGRRWLGIEQRPDYVHIAEKRLAAVCPEPREWLEEHTQDPPSPPRIAFKRLLDEGLLAAGEELVHKSTGLCARINADGTLTCGAFHGSIHRVGALLNGAPACNGWTEWTYTNIDTERPELIDVLRALLRQSDQLKAISDTAD